MRAQLLRQFRALRVEPQMSFDERPDLSGWLASFHKEIAGLLTNESISGDEVCRLTGWTVAETVAHLEHGERLACATVLGATAGTALSELASSDWDVDELVRTGVSAGLGRPLTDAVAGWAVAAEATREAVTRAGSQNVRWGFGLNARDFAIARLAETWAHTVDICDAVGLELAVLRRWADVVSWWAMRTLPYALARARHELPDRPGIVVSLYDPVITLVYGSKGQDRIVGSAFAFAALGTRRHTLVDDEVHVSGMFAHLVAEMICTFPRSKASPDMKQPIARHR